MSVVKVPSPPSAGLTKFGVVGLFCRTRTAMPLEVYFGCMELNTVAATINESRMPGIVMYHLRSTARKLVDKFITSALSHAVDLVARCAALSIRLLIAGKAGA